MPGTQEALHKDAYYFSISVHLLLLFLELLQGLMTYDLGTLVSYFKFPKCRVSQTIN